MSNPFQRTEMILGEDALIKLKNSSVIVFGLGGVGSYTVEALARAGIGNIAIVDNDTVNLTNINRQLIATHSTIGRLKTDVVEERIKDINKDCIVTKFTEFYNEESNIDLTKFDYVVDAIDTVSAKIHLAKVCEEKKVPIISSMGTGNKIDPTKFAVDDIYKTSVCPLARVMRKELKVRGVKSLKVVYSTEQPLSVEKLSEAKKQICGSVSFVPPVAGMIMAGEVIKNIVRL